MEYSPRNPFKRKQARMLFEVCNENDPEALHSNLRFLADSGATSSPPTTVAVSTPNTHTWMLALLSTNAQFATVIAFIVVVVAVLWRMWIA